MATGTGSGKTEAFLIPIVDDCLRHPAASRGGAACRVIIYPMNALANDQLDRLRKLLAGTGVTFGRYTGDTPLDEQDAQQRGVPRPATSPAEERYTRREIQDQPPHILITNYVMLELLLLRKRDQQIFQGVKPRFLVLDEVHTYTGILGAEVACLIRRFKEHTGLAPGELACIGTSATILGDDKAAGRQMLIRFASELFGESFSSAQDGLVDEGAVIEERYEPIAWPASALEPVPTLISQDLEGINPDDPADVRTLAHKTLGIELPASDPDVHEALYQAIDGRRAFAELEALLASPRSLSAVVDAYTQLPGRRGESRDRVEREVMALLLLGSAARKPGGGELSETRFRPKIHLVVRSLAPLSACLRCGRLLTDGVTECRCQDRSDPEHGTGIARALLLGLCRSCGADYRIGSFVVTDEMLRTGPRQATLAGQPGDRPRRPGDAAAGRRPGRPGPVDLPVSRRC